MMLIEVILERLIRRKFRGKSISVLNRIENLGAKPLLAIQTIALLIFYRGVLRFCIVCLCLQI